MLSNGLSEEDMRILLLLCEENNTSESCPNNSMPLNELSEEDGEGVLRPLFEGNNTSELYPNDTMGNQDSPNGNQSGGPFNNSINETTNKSIRAEESICENRSLVDTSSRDYPETTRSISSANQNTNNSFSESQVDSSSSPTPNKKTVDPKKRIRGAQTGYSGGITRWMGDLKVSLPNFQKDFSKNVENCLGLFDEISKHYAKQLYTRCNGGSDKARALHERSKSWMLGCIKDMSKYALFIFPDLLGFKVWIEKNYTFKEVCADSNSSLTAIKSFYKTIYMMSVFECLQIYIRVLAKTIGCKLLEKKPSDPKNLVSLLSTIGPYKNERCLIGHTIARLIRCVARKDAFSIAYRRSVSARLLKMGTSYEEILFFDTMTRILFIMNEGDFSYFNRNKRFIKDNISLIDFVGACSSPGEGMGRLIVYLKDYSDLLDEQLGIRDKNPLKMLTIDGRNVLEMLECLRGTLLEVNWTIMTSDIVIERFARRYIQDEKG
jgi:hypothetical protein